ncbi:hypothetical protein MPCS_01784 (plasmid) [Candidatus Megaera polyxenophila]|jgi:hypothetical protein|nr:hypothetical protein MPCS_01784 [Candidatus Megaera polyxenophila]
MKKLSAVVNITAKMPIGVVMSKRNTIISSAWSDLPIVPTIRNSTITYPSFFFEINSNREVS